MVLSFRAELARRGLEVAFDLADGERVALLGPNGAGKSSVLEILAGILRPDRGRAELDGRVMFDLGSGPGRWRPPWDRGVAMLAQDPLLFPHLDALDNVAFGPRSIGRGRAAATATAHRWLTEVGIEAYADTIHDGPTTKWLMARARGVTMMSGDLAGQADGVDIGPDDVVVVSIGTNDAAPWPKRCVDPALRQTAVSWTRRSWWRPSRWCATATS